MEALTLPGVEAGTWQIRGRFDGAASRLANRHYSRERQSPQVGGPSFVLILVTPCERAVWITKRHSPETTSRRILADGLLGAWRCSMFRNEGAGLSSDLITAAMELTGRMWGTPPAEGWVTYVDKSKVASRNPGYCFKQAGWWRDKAYDHPSLVRLRAWTVDALYGDLA